MKTIKALVAAFVFLLAADASAAALTAARQTQSKNLGAVKSYLMKASTAIYAGGLVMIDANGLAVPASAEASNHGVVGVAQKSVTSAGSGSYYVQVQEGWFLFAGTTLGQEDVGNILYAEDDQTVDDATGSNQPIAGLLMEYVTASQGWVHCSPIYQARINSVTNPLVLTDSLTLSEGLVVSQSANNKLTLTENSEVVNVEFKSNELEMSTTSSVAEIDFGALGTTLTLANGQAIGSGTDAKLSFTDNSETLTLEFKNNEIEWSSATGVVELDLGALSTTLTLANGQTIGSGTDNKLTLGDNAEDLTVEFKSNEVELSSSTAVVVFDFGTVLPISSATGALGWSIAASANQACNTTCTHACVFGQDTGDMSIEACTSADSDVCVCAGAN